MTYSVPWIWRIEIMQNPTRHIDLSLYGVLTTYLLILYMALPPRDQRHQYLKLEGLEYTDADITDFEESLGMIYGKEIHRDVDGAQGCSGTEFREAILDLDTAGALQFQLRGAESARQILDKGDLNAYWVGISSVGDFLSTTPSYTSIRDLMLRLCHRLIACNIVGRSQAPEKVFEVVCLGRKRGVMISGEQIVARLAEQFGLLTEERL
ncbi:hypothetical protein Tco_0078755 [Tanacetum coccineum]